MKPFISIGTSTWQYTRKTSNYTGTSAEEKGTQQEISELTTDTTQDPEVVESGELIFMLYISITPTYAGILAEVQEKGT